MSFRFVDIFAGIGGMRLAGELAGGICVFSSEIDLSARNTYAANFGALPSGDITKISGSEIPEHDLLFAGFPCQSFSKGGRSLGFDDARGTLFFEVARIARDRRPHTLILENVKGLVQHDGGRTMQVIVASLLELGYTVSWKVMNANRFGLAQSRERVIFVAKRGREFQFPSVEERPISVRLRDVLDPGCPSEVLSPELYSLLDHGRVKETPGTGLVFCGYRNKAFRKAGVRQGSSHLSRAHKQPNRIYASCGTHPTLSSQEPSGRYFVLHEDRVRKLSLGECFRLQGFPENFIRTGSYSDQQRQVGNSVPVAMIAEITCLAVGAPTRMPSLLAA